MSTRSRGSLAAQAARAIGAMLALVLSLAEPVSAHAGAIVRSQGIPVGPFDDLATSAVGPCEHDPCYQGTAMTSDCDDCVTTALTDWALVIPIELVTIALPALTNCPRGAT